MKQYCHLCSGGEVVNGLKKINRELEETHQHCIKNQNEYSIKMLQLEQELASARERVNEANKENSNLGDKINSLEALNRTLVEQLKQTEAKLSSLEKEKTKEPGREEVKREK